jgi:hypothetical protein
MKDFFDQSNMYKILGLCMSVILVFYSVMNKNPIAVVLSVMLFFVIQIVEILVDIKDNVHFSNHLMMDIVEDMDEMDEMSDDELFDLMDGMQLKEDSEPVTPKPNTTPVILDNTDDKGWAELMKYIKKQKDSND